MRKLPEKFPAIVNAFKAGMFVVCTSDKLFSAVSVAEQYTNFSKNSISRCQNFRCDQHIEKSVSLGATITKTNLPSVKEKLKQKATTISNTNNIRKEMGQTQRSESNIA